MTTARHGKRGVPGRTAGMTTRAPDGEPDGVPPDPIITRNRTADVMAALVRSFGWDEETLVPMFTSTRQASILNPARVEAGLRDNEGPLSGISVTTGSPWWHSPHEAYRQGATSSPNGVLVGDTSVGKSAFLKTEIGRLIETGGRAVVFDRKRQSGSGYSDHGEYERLASIPSIPTARLILDRTPGQGAVINILDPAIARVDDEETHAGQDELLRLAAEVALGRALTQKETTALAAAHGRAWAENSEPTVTDVVTALYGLDTRAAPGPSRDGVPVLEALGLVDRSSMVEWGLDVALALKRFVDGDLSGLINGATHAPDGGPLDLTAPLIVVDVSAMAPGSIALGFMQVVVISYLESRWMTMPGDKLIVIEEAYSDEDAPRVAKMLKRTAKRARGTGTMLLSAWHHLSDVQDGSDLWALIKETGVQYLYRQRSRHDAEAVCRFWDLDPGTYVPLLTSLPKGQFLVVMGSRPPEVIQHIRTSQEMWITDTDAALYGVGQEAGS